MVFATLIWCGTLTPFLVIAIRDHQQGNPNWIMSLLLVPFLLGGIFMIVGTIVFARRALALVRGGGVVLEVSEHPLVPGNRYEVYAQPAKPGALSDIRLALVCEEAATYQQGTSTRTDRRKVYVQDLPLSETAASASSGVPFRATVDLPATVMHSFDSGHNKIIWKFEVRGKVGTLNYSRGFPVVVFPAGGHGGTEARA
jgi:hypothetical protein